MPSLFHHLNKSFAPHMLLLAGATALLFVTNAANAAVVVVHPNPRLPMVHVHSWVAGPIWVAPPPPHLVVMPAPRPGWIWSPGYWRWTGGTYVWIDGVWLAERPGFVFVTPYWERTPAGWRMVAGGWARRPF